PGALQRHPALRIGRRGRVRPHPRRREERSGSGMSRKHAPTIADLHRAWLALVDTDGPFLAVPALERAWPQGIPQPDARALAFIKDAKPAFEKAWEHWDTHPEDDAALDLYREARDTWVDGVLRQGLRWGTAYTVPAPTTAEVRSPDHAAT